jgi:hypothetical protein
MQGVDDHCLGVFFTAQALPSEGVDAPGHRAVKLHQGALISLRAALQQLPGLRVVDGRQHAVGSARLRPHGEGDCDPFCRSRQ